MTGQAPAIPQIDDFVFDAEPIGEGTYGWVYAGTFKGLDRRAVKVFKPDVVNTALVHREIEKVTTLKEHPGIVTVYDFDLTAVPYFYVMSLHGDKDADGHLEPRTIDRLTNRSQPDELWRILLEVSDALAYLHQHGIIHCDIKPSNILLTDEAKPRVKICDFGQSRLSRLAEVDVSGTAIYASPEQLRHPDQVSEGSGFRWDIYSFGCLTFKLITGVLPRLGGMVAGAGLQEDAFSPSDAPSMLDSPALNAEDVAEKLEDEPEPKWPSLPADLASVRAVVDRCLSLDPAKRYTDMCEVDAALRAARERVLGRPRRTLRNALLLAVSIAAAVAALAVSAWLKSARDAECIAGYRKQLAAASRAGDWPTVGELSRRLLDKASGDEDAHFSYCKALLEQGRLEELNDALTPWASADRREPIRAAFLEAQRLCRHSQDSEAAAGLFRLCLESGTCPEDLKLESYRRLAAIYGHAGEFDRELQVLSEWLAARDGIEARMLRASAYLRQHSWTPAINDVRAAKGMNPSAPAVVRELPLYEALEERISSLESLRERLDHPASRTDALVERSVILMSIRQYALARDDVVNALQRFPQSIRLQHDVRMLAASTGVRAPRASSGGKQWGLGELCQLGIERYLAEYRDVLDNLYAHDKLVRVDPRSPSAHAGRADCLLGLKLYPQAAAEARLSLAAAANTVQPWILLLRALHKSGDKDAALVAANQALDRFPDQRELLFLKGDVMVALGRCEEAANCFTRIIEIDPDAHVYAQRAHCYDMLGRAEEAEADRRESRRLSTDAQQPQKP